MPLTNVEKYSDLEASVRWEMSWRGKWRRDEDMNRLIWTRISAPAALSRVSKDDAWWWDYPAVYAAGRVGPRLLRPGKVGGGIERRGKVRFQSQKPEMGGKVTDNSFTTCSMSCSDYIDWVLWEWMTDDWSEDWLFISLSSLSSPILLALAACIYDKVNWQLNLIELCRQWL